MTYKNIIYSPHAADQMKERGFSREDVRWLLAEGSKTKERSVGEQRWQCKGYLGKHEAGVVFIERQNEIEIVTVQWIE